MSIARRSPVVPDPARPGQESVWDYPRPPRLEPVGRRLQVIHGATVVADTTRGFRVLETSHPPTYYLPPADCDLAGLLPSPGSSVCEWKGQATYFDVTVGADTVRRAAWSYPSPLPGFEAIRDHLAFYPSPLRCFVDGERATPQPGGFYGGWVTSHVVGPFKGAPGSSHW
ncbi:MAG TPA: DUF427 domain-containing protein [Acidimicrobiales bacterium]|nr:DUF427 domain-containing protein [Acidimicrobiales bacterium]